MSELKREDALNDLRDPSKEENPEQSEYRHDEQIYMSESRGFSIGELIDRDELQKKLSSEFKGL